MKWLLALSLPLMLAGQTVHLTLDEAIKAALKNDLDLESARYELPLADAALKRAQAGGPIRGVPSGSAQIAAVDSGLGANGSTAAAGLGGSGGGSGTGGSGGVTIQQIGQVAPNFDPNLQNATAFSHITEPQANTVASGTNSLIQAKHIYNTVFQQGFVTGGTLQITDYEQSLKENAPTDAINPAVGPYIEATVRQSLLQGFGVKLNDRFIRIAKLNQGAAREGFRARMLDVVSSVVNLYWDLSSANDELKARQQAVDIARKFLEDTQAQIQIGSLARIELPRAQAELAARQLDLNIAQADVAQRQNRLKDATGIEADSVIPADQIEVPENDNLPTLRELVATALAKRPDLAIAGIRDQTAELSALGTINPLLPSLTLRLDTLNRGSAGKGTAAPQFIGGYGTALGQIARRDFPSESAQLSFSIPFGNRSAQADYGIDQLQLRQSSVTGKRDLNAIVVAISNQATALRQARAKYTAARNTRELQEQLLTAEQQKFSFAKSSPSNLIVAQRALVNAQTSEINALASYAQARAALDQVLGQTLEVNHVALQ